MPGMLMRRGNLDTFEACQQASKTPLRCQKMASAGHHLGLQLPELGDGKMLASLGSFVMLSSFVHPLFFLPQKASCRSHGQPFEELIEQELKSPDSSHVKECGDGGRDLM